MKRILLGTVALVVLAASAADLAARLSERSGSYIGINSGGGPARRCWHLVNAGVVVRAPPLAIRGHSATGGPLGGEIRFRWLGVRHRANGNCADFKDSNANLTFVGLQDQTRVDAFGLLTGLLGYAWTDVLLYVKGGAAVARDKYQLSEFATGLPLTDGSETRRGGTVGADLERFFQ
ncbi:outer membrane protein [Bradyrhizobium sp. RDT10]